MFYAFYGYLGKINKRQKISVFLRFANFYRRTMFLLPNYDDCAGDEKNEDYDFNDDDAKDEDVIFLPDVGWMDTSVTQLF